MVCVASLFFPFANGRIRFLSSEKELVGIISRATRYNCEISFSLTLPQVRLRYFINERNRPIENSEMYLQQQHSAADGGSKCL